MRLTILSSVSVLALIVLASAPAMSAFEFVAPKAPRENTGITAVQSSGEVITAPVIEASQLPAPSAADLVQHAVNPAMVSPAVPAPVQTPDFAGQPIPLTPVVGETDALVIDARAAASPAPKRIQAEIHELPPLAMPSSPVPAVAAPKRVAVPVLPVTMQAPAAIPAPIMPMSNTVVQSPVMPAPVSAAAAPVSAVGNENAPVEGFGRDVPLVLALQQIVPPSYRYSFDDGISPGMRVSWTGGQSWKNVISEIAQHNNLNVDIVSNVVAFHRGGASSIPADASPSVTGFAPESFSATPMASVSAPVAAPVSAPVTSPAAINWNDHAATQSVAAIETAAPTRSVLASTSAFDAVFEDDLPAKGRVENKRILTSDASMAVQAVNTTPDEIPSAFSLPLPLTSDDHYAPSAPNPVARSASSYEADMASAHVEIPRSSSENMVPVMSNIASAPSYVTPDMGSAQEWRAFKGETLRQALTTWSNNAGVSLVWSAEYDYPLQTDVRIAASYTDAVRTLLAGFAKAQPRPLGRLFDNQNAGAQPVLIVETQRLTN